MYGRCVRRAFLCGEAFVGSEKQLKEVCENTGQKWLAGIRSRRDNQDDSIFHVDGADDEMGANVIEFVGYLISTGLIDISYDVSSIPEVA